MAAFPLWVNAVDALPLGSAETCSLRVKDLFACDVHDTAEQWHGVLLSSFLTDLTWLLRAAPELLQVRDVLCILSGEKGTATLTRDANSSTTPWKPTSSQANTVNPFLTDLAAARMDASKVAVLEPPLPFTYGTHHAKFALCVNDKGIRVAIFTANLVETDWTQKTQGIYVQDFPRWPHETHPQQANTAKGDDFKFQLKVYLEACGLLGETAAATTAASPLSFFSTTSFLDAFDFSLAKVWLVTSTPGSRSPVVGPARTGWHRLQQVLSRVVAPADAQPLLTWQYSSQGSLNDTFLSYLAHTMATSERQGDSGESAQGVSVDVRVVYPTQEEVRESLEGWRGGLALPLRMQSCHPFVNERLHRWGAQGKGGRCCQGLRRYALPHIKTYARVTRGDSGGGAGGAVVWFLLTSANLSQAAWGTAPHGTALTLAHGVERGRTRNSVFRSYEVGVLFDASSVVKTQGHADCYFSVTPSRLFALPEPGTATDLIPVRVWQPPMTPSPTSADAALPIARTAPCLMLPYDVVAPQPYSSNAAVHAYNHGATRVGTPERPVVSTRDVPWVLDFPHRSRDALGLTFDEAMRDAKATVQWRPASSAHETLSAAKRPRAE